MRTGVVLGGMFLLVLAFPLQAQTSGTTFEVSPFAGYLFGGKIYDLKSPDTPPAGVSLGVADHFDYGIQIGYNLANGLEPEITWSRTETHFVSVNIGLPATLTVDYVLAGLSYNFLRGGVRPYVSLDFGAAVLEQHQLGPLSETDFTGSLGLGVKTFLTPNFGLRFEARGYASRLGKPPFGIECTTFSGPIGGPVIPGPCPSKDWLLNGELTGGLVLSF